MASNYNISNKEGVDVTATYLISSSTPEYPAAPFLVGEHVLGNNDTEWVFVLAGSAISAGMTVSIDAAFNANPTTNTLANNLLQVGFAQVAIPNGYNGWVAIRGEALSLLSKGVVTKNSALYISSSAGILTNATTSFAKITGVVISTSYQTTSTTTRVGNASWPRAVQ